MTRRALVMSREELLAAGVKLGPDSPIHELKKPRAKPRDLEGIEQRRLFQWIEEEGIRRHPELELLYAVPNFAGFHGSKAARLRSGAKAKAEGRKKGVPDLVLPVGRGAYLGLYLELKAEKYPEKEQRAWLEQLSLQGYRATWQRGWEAARDELLGYLALEPTVGVLRSSWALALELSGETEETIQP